LGVLWWRRQKQCGEKKKGQKPLIFKAVNLLAFPGVRRSAEDVFTLCESFFSRNLHIVHLNFLSVFPLKNVDFVEQIARYWYKVTTICQNLSVDVQNPQ
jgi:hypothetical protein